MVEIELTAEVVKAYNAGEGVHIWDGESVDLYITKDRSRIFSRRVGGMKCGCYLLSPKDIATLNNKESIFFYNGAVKIYLIKTCEETLEEVRVKASSIDEGYIEEVSR